MRGLARLVGDVWRSATTRRPAVWCRQSRTLHSSTATRLPDHTHTVVIGGGIVGNSVAYHLAKLLGGDVVHDAKPKASTGGGASPSNAGILLLEQNQLTAGTTWHAAGLMVTFGSLSETSTEFRKYTKKLYSEILERETGQSTGFEGCGFIELATNADRQEEFRRVAEFNRQICGVEVDEIGPEEVKKLFPLCRTDDILCGFYVKDDGRVNPVDAARAFAKGAKMRGADIREGVRVLEVLTEGAASPSGSGRKKVAGVRVDDSAASGPGATKIIKCDRVVNAAGMWARQLAEQCTQNIPLKSVCNQAAEHYYLITDSIPEIEGLSREQAARLPVVEDPSSYTYIRKERGGLMIGLFEGEAAGWRAGADIPADFAFGELTPDWDRLAPYVEKAMQRVPISLETGVSKFFCGPESFTPDLSPILGEMPELSGYFVAAGLNSIGILTGGGVGRLIADWAVNGREENAKFGVDITGVTPDRLHSFQNTVRFRSERVKEALGMVYKPHYPGYSLQSARNVKRSPLHAELERRGACFVDVSGWEGAAWFAGTEGTGKGGESRPCMAPYGWGKPHFFRHWESEHRAVREAVGLIDMSFMSKFRVQGRDAGQLLNRLATSEIVLAGDRLGNAAKKGAAEGTKYEGNAIVYTQFLAPTGRMELDVTIAKFAEDDYLVVATDTCHRHCKWWLNNHIAADEFAVVTDVSGALAQINLQGPRSRQLLDRVVNGPQTDALPAEPVVDFSDAAFPFRAFKRVPIGFCAEVYASRLTYVGELGYELFVPTEHAADVHTAICAVGETPDFGIKHVGLKALASLRLEKGYRDMRHDMDNLDTVLEVGLGFTCELEGKSCGQRFIGQEPVAEQRAEMKRRRGLGRRLVSVLVDSSAKEGDDSCNSDDFVLLNHGEVLYRDDVPVGEVRAGSWGHSVNGAVGLAMIEGEARDATCREMFGGSVTKAYISTGRWEVGVAGRRYPCGLSLKPPYDPENRKIRGEKLEAGS